MNKESGCHILFISDDVDNWTYTKLVLEDARNDEIRYVSSYDEMRAIAGEVFDLIIIELTLTFDGDDGIAVYEQLRKIPALKRSPVLLWRVPSPKNIYQRAQSLGIAGCIELVSTPEELITARDSIRKGGTHYPPLR